MMDTHVMKRLAETSCLARRYAQVVIGVQNRLAYGTARAGDLLDMSVCARMFATGLLSNVDSAVSERTRLEAEDSDVLRVLAGSGSCRR